MKTLQFTHAGFLQTSRSIFHSTVLTVLFACAAWGQIDRGTVEGL